ncbi:FliG C-terminal domain-containing protein [Parvularcula sp. LCG005]|uniref:FliG C-terminal domain-containing protein n=1 Tax=Parvularcula sp. LCG005 TaxID=3078805 RepID=UPI002942C213|nr:FliG C-terminal domain-containing protein [Parvularcula sp. LCG005]WOI52933.1 FliG C-terminal domain-containing protein [Parvularcula sp. LCG005]
MSSSVPARLGRRDAAPASTVTLSPTERVAVILSLLEPEQAKSLTEHYSSATIDRIIASYERMRNVPKPVLLQTIASFITEVRSKSPKVYGGASEAARLAEAIARADAESSEMAAGTGLDGREEGGSLSEGATAEQVFHYLESMDPAILARLLSHERASVVAAIIGRLSEDLGGKLMSALSNEKAIAVTAQIAQGAPVAKSVMDAITESLRRHASTAEEGDVSTDQYDPLPRLTAILNRCPASRQQTVLDPLRAQAAEHAEAIEQGLLRFGTLHERLPRNAAPILFREMEEATLHIAVRFGTENAKETVEFLYGNISQRLAEQIRERINALPMPSEAEGEAAQAEVIATLLSWAEEGRFTMQ